MLLQQHKRYNGVFELTPRKTLTCKICVCELNFRDNNCLVRHLKTQRHINTSLIKEVRQMYEKFTHDEKS